jgi:hypothetical protein
MAAPYTYITELDANNIVLRGIVCDNIEWAVENLGGRWVPTYMDVPGKTYAGIGFEYLPESDNFRPVQPFPSWTWDAETWSWIPPVPYPDESDAVPRRWDEASLSWAPQNNVV